MNSTSPADLVGVGLAAGRQPEGAADLARSRSPGASRRSRSARSDGLLVGELAVEQAERLGRHGRRVADGATGVGVGRVVDRQDRDQQRPLDVDVNAPPRGLVGRRGLPSAAGHRLAGQHLAGDRRIDARPAGLVPQVAADGQDRVADLLGRQSPHGEPPEPSVRRVRGQLGRGRPRRHPVGARQHDQPVHRLDPPAVRRPARRPASRAARDGSPARRACRSRSASGRCPGRSDTARAGWPAPAPSAGSGDPSASRPAPVACRVPARMTRVPASSTSGTPGSTAGPTSAGLPRSSTCAWPSPRSATAHHLDPRARPPHPTFLRFFPSWWVTSMKKASSR